MILRRAPCCPKRPCASSWPRFSITHACVLRKQIRCRAADRLLSSYRVPLDLLRRRGPARSASPALRQAFHIEGLPVIGGRLPDGEDGQLMPSTPLDNGHQESLRELIGKVLPDAGAQHIAEAVAAGYGYRTHRAFMKAIRAVEAGDPAPVHDFDPGRLIDRLQALGESVGKQEDALRFLLTVMADGPRSGPPPEQDGPDEADARQSLRTAYLYTEVGLWQDAGTILDTAMGAAPASLKGEVAAALEQAAPHAEIAATNFPLG